MDEGYKHRVENEFKCDSCGYVLRGIAVDGLCPECGTPVIHSVRKREESESRKKKNYSIASCLGYASGLACLLSSIILIPRGYSNTPILLIFAPFLVLFSTIAWALAKRTEKQRLLGRVSRESTQLARAGLASGAIAVVLYSTIFAISLVLDALSV